jgi:hypothetical protein
MFEHFKTFLENVQCFAGVSNKVAEMMAFNMLSLIDFSKYNGSIQE